MRTTSAMRSTAAALLTGGILTVTAAGTSVATATGPTHTTTGDGGSDSPTRGTVVSRDDLNLRQHPTTKSPAVDRLSPGSHDRALCSVLGERILGDRTWYWLVDAGGWVSAVFVDTGGQRVPSCDDRCPDWKDGGSWQTPDICNDVIASTRLP